MTRQNTTGDNGRSAGPETDGSFCSRRRSTFASRPRSRLRWAAKPKGSRSPHSEPPACARRSRSERSWSRSSLTGARAPRRPIGPSWHEMLQLPSREPGPVRHRSQGRPTGTQPRRRCRHHDGDREERGCARLLLREHRRDTERYVAPRHHELHRRVLQPQPGY